MLATVIQKHTIQDSGLNYGNQIPGSFVVVRGLAVASDLVVKNKSVVAGAKETVVLVDTLLENGKLVLNYPLDGETKDKNQ